MEVSVITPREGVVQTMQRCLELGTYCEPRGMPIYEITNFNLRIEQPWRFIFDLTDRELNHTIGAIELAALIGGYPTDLAAARLLPKSLSLFREEDGQAWGSYGPRVRGQLALVLDEFADDLMTRRAVMTIYDGREDLGRNVKDIPCTLNLQFFVRDGTLQMRTTMRSNDVWFGLPYDLMMFCGLQRSIAYWLGMRCGPYYHSVGSMHLYEKQVVAARHVSSIESHKRDEFDDHQPAPWLLPDVRYAVEYCQSVLGGGLFPPSIVHQPPQTWLETWMFKHIVTRSEP